MLAQYGYTYDKADNRTSERRDQIVSTGTFNNVDELTALSGGGVVGFTGTTTEEAALTVGGQAAQDPLRTAGAGYVVESCGRRPFSCPCGP